ncbi:MAG: hypothetical protein QOH70_1872 [Blastocatellia bacterium]|jgi:hypothetical protein|nr:hypothetical protein [Blastocatellia bacterium]
MPESPYTDILKTDDQIAQDEYERGQRDGSKASTYDQTTENWNMFRDEDDPYRKGYNNGVANPSSDD